MTNLSVSLIIVSRDRPDGLRRTLTSLQFQTYDMFEVIVVSDQLPEMQTGSFKFVNFDEPNISKARNLGMEQASGDIIAFCDDDAIPEPQWLERLVKGFDDPSVGLAGGYVRGRNGISFQWKGISTDLNGDDMGQSVRGEISLHSPSPLRFVRPVGTNCAFRASAMTHGFDPVFSFYLDETELALRLSRAGWVSAIIPKAEVQHGYAESASRSSNRVPKDLFQIGVSKGAFVAAYGDLKSLDVFRKEQHERLVQHMVSGWLEPRDVTRIYATLVNGIKHGLGLTLDPPEIKLAQSSFQKCFHLACRSGRCVTSVNNTNRSDANTLIKLSFTSLFHKRGFSDQGYWFQKGGQFGRSLRTDKLWSYHRRSDRFEREENLLSDQRVFSKDS